MSPEMEIGNHCRAKRHVEEPRFVQLSSSGADVLWKPKTNHARRRRMTAIRGSQNARRDPFEEEIQHGIETPDSPLGAVQCRGEIVSGGNCRLQEHRAL